MKDIIVKANDVEYAYKKNSDETPKVLVLKELNTEICEGEFVAVIGATGPENPLLQDFSMLF